jgi:hypothetical protein
VYKRQFLSDAKKPKNGGYLKGAGKDGWLLTENGLKFAQARVSELKGVDLSRDRLSFKEKRWLQIERSRLLASEAFAKFTLKGVDAVTTQEAESFFRLDAYVSGEAREDKIIRALNSFGDDPDLGNVVNALADKVRTGGKQ